MASITGEEPKPSTVGKAQPVATCHCQKLKGALIQADATSNVASTSSNLASGSSSQPSPVTMHPLLLAVACQGYLKGLSYLIDREQTQAQPDMMPSQHFLDQLQLPAYSSGCCSNGNLGLQQAAADLEEGATVEALSAASLLEGVTLEGNTALHAVAANGDEDFLSCADLIHSKDGTLLSKQNNKGDTPLHSAARAGKSQMVSHLIVLARGDGMVEEFVRKENNRKETALHEAVRIGNNDIVMVLLEADPRLAYYPAEGTSALYLAVLQDEESIAQTLYDKSEGEGEGRFLSYSGPDGQNALHAAVLRGTGMVEKILKWNQKLASQWDCNGSTPIHFLSSRPRRQPGTVWASFTILWIHVPFAARLHVRARAKQRLLEANPTALYQPDKDGLYPIHIAASVGNRRLLAEFIEYCPSIAGLQDSRGRTFVHVAVEKWRVSIVSFACGTGSLAWILNMQDNNGNTALHLAVLAGSLRMFCSLLGNRQVHINITNNKGQTPLDIARDKIPSGVYYGQSSEAKIHTTLKRAGGRHGGRRWDHYEEKRIQRKGNDGESKELKLKDSTQTLCIGSVLIATVVFGATFALPGGYKADDHTNGGTPTLAGRYAFDAFTVAITLAFICSSMATVGFMFSGTSMLDLKSRQIYFVTAVFFLTSSVTSLTVAFALSVYMVLAPVTHKTAVGIVVISPLVVIFTNIEFWLKKFLVARAMGRRIGLTLVFLMSPVDILVDLFLKCWPFVIIFGWAAIARNH